MTVIVYLLPLALGLGFIGLIAFIWAINSGQFDDLDGAAHRILTDDDEEMVPHENRRPADGEPH